MATYGDLKLRDLSTNGRQNAGRNIDVRLILDGTWKKDFAPNAK
jgi:hypothetical protein